jgi:hypothetical protein
MKMVKIILAVFVIFLFRQEVYGQQKDSLSANRSTPVNDTIPGFIKGSTPAPQPPAKPKDSPYKTDSTARKKHDPRKATLYSTFLPGLGQFYNRKYWKIPLVAAALGIPAYTYFDNKNEYKKTQFAIAVISSFFDTSTTGMPTIPANILAQVDPRLRTYVIAGRANELRSYRNYVRKNQDYSVLFFMLFWGLQIVDATVDAHLKEFDISDKLTMRFQPSDGSTTRTTGFSLVFDLHSSRYRPIPLP